MTPAPTPDAPTMLDAALTKARECLSRVCRDQRFKLIAQVPARPGIDDDLVIADGIEAGLRAVEMLRELSPAIEDLMLSFDPSIGEDGCRIPNHQVERVKAALAKVKQ